MISRTLINEEDLKSLFPNQIQRDIFVKLINQIIEIITERTLLCVNALQV